ncbi:MAG: hypothetical protein WC649_12435 [Desulfobacteria bacterium]
MKTLKRSMIILLSTLLLTSWAVPSFASDNAFRDLFENSLYGGLAGTLVGGALLVFTKKPSDHLDYLAVGAATGVLAGVTYSVVKQSRSLVAIEDGNIKLAMPTVIPEFQETGVKGASSLMLKAELIRGKF